MSTAARSAGIPIVTPVRPRRTLQKLLLGVVCFSIAFAVVPLHRSLEDPTAPSGPNLLAQHAVALVGVTAAVCGFGALVGHMRVAFLLFAIWIGLPAAVSLIFSTM